MSVSPIANKFLEESEDTYEKGVYTKAVMILIATGLVVAAAFVYWLYEITRSISG